MGFSTGPEAARAGLVHDDDFRRLTVVGVGEGAAGEQRDAHGLKPLRG